MKFSHFYFGIALIILVLLQSCKPGNLELVKFTGEAQGTYYAVSYYTSDGNNYQTEIDSLLKAFDQSVSMWVPNSIISRINRNELDVAPDDVFIELFNRSRNIYRESGGAFDPTVGPLVNAWGFGFEDRMKVDQHIVDSLLPLVGFDKVKLEKNIIKADPRIRFDFNAIAQGYSVDLIGDFLKKKGIDVFLVDVGGEVLGKGIKPNGDYWRVGIEKPADNAQYGEGLKAIVALKNKALATSGNYRKFYEEDGIRYSHTIDPNTGYPVQHSLLSVSVLADDCATADAFATAFMVMGVQKALEYLDKQKNLEAYFIYSDDNGELQTYLTEGFKEIVLEEME